MTRKTIEAARDCISRINGLTPPEEQIKEMFSFLSIVERLSKVLDEEGISHLRLEAPGLPEDTAYEKAFKESICMRLNGAGIDEASDHAADRYFEDCPDGYDAAIYFAAVFSVGKILKRDYSYGFIDQALQYLLPDGWRWGEEYRKETEAHKDDENESYRARDYRREFLGDPREELEHRFDDVKICNLIEKDHEAEAIGRRIADRLPGYGDGALQLILKELTHGDLENALYALPEEAENRIMSNLNTNFIPMLKGNCILNKDSVSSSDIREALLKFEEAINAYTGDPALDSEYED